MPKQFALYLILFFSISTSLFAQPQRLTNLSAFAKTYGYVRYFYPSDEANATNWDKFLVYGSQQAEQAKNDKELMIVLETIFKPIAPEIIFNLDSSAPQQTKLSFDDSDLWPVYWQHLGLGGKNSNIYKSKRVGRTLSVKSGFENMGNFMQALPVNNFQNRHFKLKALVKVSSGSAAQLWARVDLADGITGFFDNMSDRPIQNTQWSEVEIKGKIGATAEQLVFGFMLNGENQGYVEYIRLEVKDDNGKWQQVNINNSEMDDWSGGTLEDWFVAQGTYRAKKTIGACNDCTAVQLGPEYSTMPAEATLFSLSPNQDKLFSSQISENIYLHMPLVVLADEQHTYPIASASAEVLFKKIDRAVLDVNDKYTQISDVITLWNSIQHFYPYFDQIDNTWNNVLSASLGALEQNFSVEHYERLIKRMIVGFQDGHGALYNPRATYLMLPMLFDLVEGRIVITKSLATDLKVGDLVTTINGEDVNDLLKDKISLISGSPHWRRSQALKQLRVSKHETAEVEVQRGDKRVITAVQLDKHYRLKDDSLPSISLLKDNIYYVDLDRASMPEILDVLPNMATAKGIIFDLRGYPNGNHGIISHLLSEPDTSNQWMKVPHIVYPDHAFTQWEESGWLLPVAKPHIESKVVFLTDASALSYSESILSFIEHYNLATIIGGATGGANGNVNQIKLPSGMQVAFTGMRVSKHDGTKLHLIGIKPDIEITRTLEAAIDGIDEYLEKALTIINDSL